LSDFGWLLLRVLLKAMPNALDARLEGYFCIFYIMIEVDNLFLKFIIYQWQLSAKMIEAYQIKG
jgi:hypothetical protein